MGFIVDNKIECSFDTITDRICTAKFTQQNKNIHIINCYAHTLKNSNKETQKRENFYKSIAEHVSQIPANDIPIIVGDFNAITGTLHETYPKVIGKHGKGKHNENGTALVETANHLKLVATNTLFQHKLAHITTWQTTNKNKKSWKNKQRKNPIRNQIDYIFIRQTYLPLTKNARAFGGTQCNSDHKMIITTFRMNMAFLHKPTNHKEKYDLNSLKETTTKQKFQEEVCKQTAILQQTYHNLNTEEKYKEIKNTLLQAAKNTLPNKTKNYKPPDKEIEELSKKQREIRCKIKAENNQNTVYQLKRERNKLLRQIRKKKQANQEETILQSVKEIEQTKNDSSRYFKAIRLLQSKEAKPEITIQTEDKQYITNHAAQEKQIQQYFKKTFNTDKQTQAKQYKPTELETPFTVEEIKQAAHSLHKGKSSPVGDMEAELIKSSPNCTFELIANLINEIAATGNMPPDINIANLIPLPKPGKPKGPIENLRPIMLLTTTRKLLAICLLKRIEKRLNTFIPPTQAAYRSGRSTTEHVLTCKLIAEKTLESNNYKAHLILLDLSKAFDTINRYKLLTLLENILNQDELHLISLLTNNLNISIKLKDIIGQPFSTSKGVPQGNSLSPILFTTYLANALDPDLLQNYKYKEYHHKKQNIDMQYADDTGWLVETEEDMENIQTNTTKTLTEQDLIVNENKTEIHNLTPNNINWKQCKYLGSKLGTNEDIKHRKQLTMVAMQKQEKIFLRKDISKETKLRVFNAFITPIFLYNSELWHSSITIDREINTFQRKLLRRTLKIRWYEKITNTQLYAMTHETPWNKVIKTRRLKLLGHILRLDNNTPAKKALRKTIKYIPNHKKGKTKTHMAQNNTKRHRKPQPQHQNPHTWSEAYNRKTWRENTNNQFTD